MKTVLVVLLKVAILFLIFPFLWISLVLNSVSEPVFVFRWPPFLQAMIIPLLAAAVIAMARRTATPIYWAVFCCAFTFFYFAFPGRASLFIAPFAVAGMVSFLYRNKITEPMLVMLPIAIGTCLYINWIYTPYLVTWAYYTTGLKTFPEAVLAGLTVLNTRLVAAAVIAPLLGIYFLGKHAHVSLYNYCRARWGSNRG